MNLHQLKIPHADGPDLPQKDFGLRTQCHVEVVFKDHQLNLLRLIDRFPVVVGCVAWMTDETLLQALSTRKHVSLIVQKEDFLRPDITPGSQRLWAKRLRAHYDRLPHAFARYEIPYISSLSFASDGHIDAVRCVGNHNSERKPSWPRMHNKFLVFCDLLTYENPDYQPESRCDAFNTPTRSEISPRVVWTGSYNLSAAASASWENAIILDSAAVANAYMAEFGQIMAFSEVLDWTSPWVQPEYRIGT